MRQGLRFSKSNKQSTRRSLKPNGKSKSSCTQHRRLLCEGLEDRRLLSGVTLITHGYETSGNPDNTIWVDSMVKAVAERIATTYTGLATNSSQVAQFEMTITNPFVPNVSNWSYGGNFIGDPAPKDYDLSNSLGGEAVILLNWSSIAGEIDQVMTQTVANRASDYLLGSALGNLGKQLVGSSIHLIGHSRGASVIGALAEDLGKAGIWVDQSTFLDAHPLAMLDWGNAKMTVPNNVVFADSYWREGGVLSPNGQPVFGAVNVQMNEDHFDGAVLGGYGGSSDVHSDVHLWYHGTIDNQGPFSDGDPGIYVGTNDADDWYSSIAYDSFDGPMPTRSEGGFNLSRIVGGVRPNAGISDLLGGGGERQTVSTTGAVWPNIINPSLSSIDVHVATGSTFPFSYWYQDRDSQSTIKYYLDTNRNPIDNGAFQVGSSLPVSASTSPIPKTQELPTNNAQIGTTYYVYAKITDGTYTRYAYAPGTVTIDSLPINHDPTLSNPRVTPTTGQTSTQFSYRVDYYDADGDAPIDASIFIDGPRHPMSLESGTPANGTYVYKTYLAKGNHNYAFDFTNTANQDVSTLTYYGPSVAGPGIAATQFYFQGSGSVPATDDIEVRYTVGSGTQVIIPGSQLALPGVNTIIHTPTTLHLEAKTQSSNHQFLQWEVRVNGVLVKESTSVSVDYTLSSDTDSYQLGVASYWSYTPSYYDIAGTVASSGAAVQGATVTLVGSGLDPYITGANGCYSFTHIPGGVPYSVAITHPDYAFTPASYNITNLTDSSSFYNFSAVSADGIAPVVALTQTPGQYLDDRSQISFAWAGTDNKTPSASLLYSYQLLGSIDESWSAWGSATSVVYNLSNGVYTFQVKAKDAAGNIAVVPAKYSFAISALPKISQSASLSSGTWMGEFLITAPAGSTGISNKVVIRSEQFNLSGNAYVPVRLFPDGSQTAIGTVDYAAQELNLPVVFQKADIGYVLTLPTALSAGETRRYVIQWGKGANLGWGDSVSVPMTSSNMESFHGSYLDQNLRLWRLGSKQDNPNAQNALVRNAYLYVQVSDANGSVMDEKLLDFVPANYYTKPRPGNPDYPYYYGTAGRFYTTGVSFVETATEVWAVWEIEKYTYTESNQDIYNRGFGFQRFNKNTLAPIGQPVYSPLNDRDWYSSPTVAANGDIWLVGSTKTDTLVYSRVSPTGTILAHRLTVTAIPSGLVNPMLINYYRPVTAPDGKVWYFYIRRWDISTTDHRDRQEVYLKILNADGSTFLNETRVSLPASGSGLAGDEEWNCPDPIIDNAGKVWFSFHRYNQEGPTNYYSIFNPDGTTFKNLVQTSTQRYFGYVDPDGYIWAGIDGQVQLLNSNDTPAEPARPGNTFGPNQTVGSRCAIVGSDNYRLFDRWSTQSVSVTLSSQTVVGLMEIIDADKYSQGTHVKDLDVDKIGTHIANIPGVVPPVSQIDVSAVIGAGNNSLDFTQSGLLGGELLVSFAYSFNIAPTAHIDNITPSTAQPPAASISFAGSGSDSDGSVVAWEWSSNLDGVLSTSEDFSKSSYTMTVGQHQISFRVQDDGGLWSAPVISTITILNAKPTALIPDVPIISVPANSTFSVTLGGYDNDENGQLIVTKELSLDEVVVYPGSSNTYSVTSPSTIGQHTLSYRVIDDEGTWSDPVVYSFNVYDDISPTVTIDQASGQVDPALSSPIIFTIVFSEPVAGFTANDVTLSGTAPGTLVPTVTGSGTTYTLAVSGMNGGGMVVASILAGKAHDAAGNPNLPSTSTDNAVTYVISTRTWDGGGTDNNWSTAANWVGDVAPSPGDNLVFPVGAARLNNNNDYPSGTIFSSIVVSSGYHIQNNEIHSTIVEVQGNAVLSATTIVCDTLTIGSPLPLTLSFADTLTFSSGGKSQSIAVDDFNGDGNSDLAISFNTSSTIGIFLGNGSGEFAASGTFPTGGNNPLSVVADDFNGDGKKDLAVANYSSNNIRVLLGDGNGGFTASSTKSSGGIHATSLTVGDFNGDGKLDLAVTNDINEGTVGVLFGDGSGGFADASMLSSGGNRPLSVTASDFNNDGFCDLAVANSTSGRVGILLSNGSGGFNDVITFPSGGTNPSSVTVGDFNGDGKKDLVVTDYVYNGRVGVLIGNGSGGFSAASMFSSGGRDPYTVAVADFNGDGRSDLAVSNVSSNKVGVLLGNGSGGFDDAAMFSSGGAYPYFVTVGDFNGDSKKDLVVASWTSSGTVGVLLNTSHPLGAADALTTGIPMPTIDNAGIANTAASLTNDEPQSEASNLPASIAADTATPVSTTIDSPVIPGQTIIGQVNSLNTPVNTAASISFATEAPQTAPAAIPVVFQTISTSDITSAANLPKQSGQQNIESFLTEPLIKDPFESAFTIEALLAPKFDNQFTNSFSSPILMTDRLNKSGYEELADSLEKAKIQSSTMTTESQNVYKLALQSIMKDFQDNFVTEQEVFELLAGKHSRKHNILATKAVDEIHMDLVGAID